MVFEGIFINSPLNRMLKRKLNKTIYLFAAIFCSLYTGKAAAQANVTAHATAEVILALTATETSQLNFGRFSPETAGGEVKITPQGVRTSSGTVMLSAGVHNSASFFLTGQYEATVSITLPQGAVMLTSTENSKSMEVYDWESYPAAGLNAGILNNGSLVVNIGATLKVGNMIDNPVGIYAGMYSITFAYN
jgi:hypothetical protein